MPRPRIDVVIPVLGSEGELRAVVERWRALALRDGDRLVVVDNRPEGAPPAPDEVVRAPERQTSYFARNRGAQAGDAPWIVFADADVEPARDLLDRYFDPPPGERAGVLSGAVEDEPVGADAPAAARYAMLARTMAQPAVDGRWPYAQTANCAVRREVFAALGGFDEGVRSGADADFCFRARAAGWAFEARPGARVVHRSRVTLRALLRQQARHGAGAAWVDRRHPGSFPSRLGPGLVTYSARQAGAAVRARARGDRDAFVLAGVGLATLWAFELGRGLPNEVR